MYVIHFINFGLLHFFSVSILHFDDDNYSVLLVLLTQNINKIYNETHAAFIVKHDVKYTD